MKTPCLQSKWLAGLSFLVAMLVGLCVVGCDKDNSDSGGSNTGSGGGNLTLSQYDAVKAYMSYDDVCGIMGRHAYSSVNMPFYGGQCIGYTWTSDDGDVINVAIIDPPTTSGISGRTVYGAWMKDCNLNDNNARTVRGETMYDL